MKKLIFIVMAVVANLCAWGSNTLADKDVQQANALAERLSARLAEKVEFVKIKAPKKGVDVYSLAQQGDKVVIGGNTANSMAVGLNRYLKKHCNTTVSWYADIAVELPDVLPGVGGGESVTSTVPQRFFLNYCTFGYTMVYWQWRDWERFIDWMALNGVNMPLAITGQEAVWMKVWTAMGMTPDEVRSYFTGPSYLAWHRMANVDEWHGPLPQHWLDTQVELQQRILERERSLNMRPVMNAFAGHVPRRIKELYPTAKISMLSDWAEFAMNERTYFLDSEDPLFEKIQKMFIDEQGKLFGYDHIYGIDPFNEMDPPSWEASYLARVTKHMYESVRKADPKAEWLQMGWILYYQKEWTAENTRAMLEAVPKGKMTILDYFCDRREVWRTRDKFSGQPYIWCYLGNFGGNTVWEGNPKLACERIDAALKEGGKNLVGIGSTLEGLDVQQAPYECVLEKAWATGETTEQIINSIADRHAGAPNETARKAWATLYNDAYTVSAGTHREMIGMRPLLNKVRSSYKVNLGAIIDAWQTLIKQERVDRDAMVIDITTAGREVLHQLFMIEKSAFDQAFAQKDLAAMRQHATLMRELLKDIDTSNSFQRHCTLDAWLEQASSYGNTPALCDYYRNDALTLITTWGGCLNDYATRVYQGLVAQYHAVRWGMYIDRAIQCVKTGTEWDNAAWEKQVGDFEQNFKYDPAAATRPETDLLTFARLINNKYAAQIEAARGMNR